MKRKPLPYLLVILLLFSMGGIRPSAAETAGAEAFAVDTVGMKDKKVYEALYALVNEPLEYEQKRVRVTGYLGFLIKKDTQKISLINSLDAVRASRQQDEKTYYISFADPTSCCYDDGEVYLTLVIDPVMEADMPQKDQYFVAEGTLEVIYRGQIAEGTLRVDFIQAEDHYMDEYIARIWE